MHRILTTRRSWPLHGLALSRAIEQRATAEVPPHTLMRRAGLGVARLALAVAPHAARVWVAAGPGNNGGDGLDAAVRLHTAGKEVTVTFIGDAASLPDDARDALQRAQAAGLTIQAAGAPELQAGDVAIDALLGLGAARAPDGAMADAIVQLNRLPCPVLAVDLPSGLNGLTGQPHGSACVRATHTLSLLTLKPGLFTGAGRDCAGDIWLDTLGIDVDADAPDARLIGPDVQGASPRLHAQHKGSFGDVAILGGAAGMTGAALLAARAAHASGAGRVFVGLLDGGSLTHDIGTPELMFRTRWWDAAASVLQSTTIVCGCGGGDAVREILPRLLKSASRLVLDADALNAVAADSLLQHLLRARSDGERLTVLTPHPLEAARLLDRETGEVQADRLQAAQTLADRLEAIVVLKGSGSVVAGPGLLPFVNPTGDATLATAGTGDVLAGWIGGLWAQHAAQRRLEDLQRLTATAVYAHGAAAAPHEKRVLRASELIDRMQAAG